MLSRSLHLVRSSQRMCTAIHALTFSSSSLPDLLPFLKKHASTEAERQLRDVLLSKPSNDELPRAWKEQAKTAYREATYYDYALELEEDEYERGRLYMLSDHPNVAKQCYDRANAASPGTPRILISLAAWEFHQRKDYDKALEYLGEAMDATKRDNDEDAAIRIEIFKFQGLMYRSKGDFEKALSVYKAAVEAGEAEFLLEVADMNVAIENWSEARDQFQQLLAGESDEGFRAVLLHNIGNCHMQGEFYKLDNGDSALEYLEESLELKRKLKADSGELANTLNLLGVLYAKRNDIPKALVRFKEALLLARSGYGDDSPFVMHVMRNLSVLKGQKVPKFSG